MSPLEYIAEMAEDETWGDEITLAAIATVTHVNIIVFGSNNGITTIPPMRGDAYRDIYLGYLNNDHYVSLVDPSATGELGEDVIDGCVDLEESKEVLHEVQDKQDKVLLKMDVSKTNDSKKNDSKKNDSKMNVSQTKEKVLSTNKNQPKHKRKRDNSGQQTADDKHPKKKARKDNKKETKIGNLEGGEDKLKKTSKKTKPKKEEKPKKKKKERKSKKEDEEEDWLVGSRFTCRI